MNMIRLDKFLADMGCGSRAEVKQFIRKGQTAVNGVTVKSPDYKVNPETDHVVCRNEVISYTEYEYYLLNKPAGVITATEDSREKTVLDLIRSKKRKDLFPAGRLDKDTEGLLLITNDGPLAHNLLAPGKHVSKTYYARIDGTVTEEDAAAFREGVDIGDPKPTLPADLRILSSGPESEIELTITEGRFHQVKRMFEAKGKKVLYLKRISMGSLKLDPTLAPGEYRALTEEEIRELTENKHNIPASL